MSLATTTLNTAITKDAVILALASTSAVRVGYMLGIDSEILQVSALVGNGTTSVRVLRGVDGTAAVAHDAASTVSVGVPDDFAESPSTYPTIAPSGTVAVGNGPGSNPSFEVVGDVNPFDQELNTDSDVEFATVTTTGAIDGDSFSVGGVAGASGGPFTAITSITVVGGIITAITGT